MKCALFCCELGNKKLDGKEKGTKKEGTKAIRNAAIMLVASLTAAANCCNYNVSFRVSATAQENLFLPEFCRSATVAVFVK